LNRNIGVPFEKACGGNAECLTCHVLIQEDMLNMGHYIKPDDREEDALAFADGL
jgi:ferredoxin